LNSWNRRSPGALAPNPSMASIAPSSVTHRRHPNAEAASMPRRMRTAGGSTSLRYASGWAANSSHDGIETTRSILVKADRDLTYGEVRKVMDLLADNKMTTVLLAAAKEK